MTKKDFIANIINEITISGALNLNINEAEIDRIIENEKRNVFLNWRNAVETKFTVLHPAAFRTDEFRKARSIQLPSCVWGVQDMREIKNSGRWFGVADMDLSLDRVFASDTFLSPFSSDIIMSRTIQFSYYDLMRSFTLTDMQFSFNPNTHKITVIGHNPTSGVLLRCHVAIEDSALYDDYMFFKQCVGKAMIQINRAYKFFEVTLIGGVNISTMLADTGQKYLDEVAEYQKGITPPDWFFMFQ